MSKNGKIIMGIYYGLIVVGAYVMLYMLTLCIVESKNQHACCQHNYDATKQKIEQAKNNARSLGGGNTIHGKQLSESEAIIYIDGQKFIEYKVNPGVSEERRIVKY